MNEFVSLDLYREIKLGREVVRIKKLNLRELIELSALLSYYRLSGNKETFCEICDLAVVSRKRIRVKEREEVIQEILDFNRNDKGETKEKPDDDWLQSLLAYFAREFGWAKKDVLELYPGEIPVLVKENQKQKQNEEDYIFMRLIGAFHAPDATLKSMKNRGDNGIISEKMDRVAVEGLKQRQRKVEYGNR